ncbi:MAG TPA: hypothetical protein VJV79_36755 [Polyangiaceae bacterium]|nr:hypothetical protein [Polyangiaceae bacterium]
MNEADRQIMVLALAQNADPADADAVLCQALDGLHAEAEILLEAFEAAVGAGINVNLTLAYSHANRHEALSKFYMAHMRASWQRPVAASGLDAPAMDVSVVERGALGRKLHAVRGEGEPTADG